MLLTKRGEALNCGGVEYVIGESVVATPESEYEGLEGTILEIRDGDCKETENKTPDIYCCFDPPEDPQKVRKLEEIFSNLYGQPKTIDDIVLDLVIMSPEEIEPKKHG